MDILTIETVPGRQTIAIGPVVAACCLSRSAIVDVLANVKNWSVGGELKAYTRMLESAARLVMERAADSAQLMGADAVIGFRLVTSSVSAGAAELIGYGTAVRFVELPQKAST